VSIDVSSVLIKRYVSLVAGEHSAVPALRDLLLAANATYGDVKLHESPLDNHRCKMMQFSIFICKSHFTLTLPNFTADAR
jgi:hypothetical protein